MGNKGGRERSQLIFTGHYHGTGSVLSSLSDYLFIYLFLPSKVDIIIPEEETSASEFIQLARLSITFP